MSNGNSSNAKRYFQFFLIVIAAGAIYPLIYLKTNYQETILAVFGITLPQLNVIYSFLGMSYVVGYFPSGLLSDKFSAKKLLALSLFGTAAGGFWFAQIPQYTNVVIIFVIWGFFSVFTFWSAHLKLVKLLAKPEEEGRFFGILDGGRGVVEALLASVAVAVFSRLGGGGESLEEKRTALITVIYMYSFIMLAASILTFIFLDDDKKDTKAKRAAATSDVAVAAKEKFQLKDIGDIFKNKLVFIMGFIISMSYAVYWTVYYLGGFLETNIKVNSVTVSTIMVVVLWMRPVGGIGGGFLADKIGKAKTLGGAITLASACLVGMAVLPYETSPTIFYVLVVFCGIFLYAIRGTYWSLLGDCNIDDKILGVAVGVISFLGYLPDIVLPIFNSYLFTTFGDNKGYNAYFIASAVMGAIGVGLIMLFKAMRSKAKA